MSSPFPVLQAYTDYVWDPLAVFLLGLLSFGISRIFFADTGTISHLRYPIRGQNSEWVNAPLSMFGEYWPVLAVGVLLAGQIGIWVSYGNNLTASQQALSQSVGLVFPRDVFALTVSLITFFYVFICGFVLAGGSVMVVRNDNTNVIANKASFYSNMQTWLGFFQYLFWIGLIAFTSSLQSKYVSLNLANYQASFEPTMLNCSNLVLGSGIVLIVARITKTFKDLRLHNSIKDENLREEAKLTGASDMSNMPGPAYTSLTAGVLNMILPAERNTSSLFILAVLFHTLSVFLIVYADYMKFEIAGGFLVFASVFFTFFTKNIDTFQFFFFYALWFVTTIPYFTQTLFYKGVSAFTSYQNSAVNVNPLTLEPSQINFPDNYPQTLLLLSGLSVTASILYMFRVWYTPSTQIADLNKAN